MRRFFFHTQFAGIVGNVLEHYDSALFGLLAPFIAPLFFGGHDPLVALILTYSVLAIGFLPKSLGALVFGWIGDRYGRLNALSISLFGVAAVTLSMGCLPLYQEVGAWSPFALILSRSLQSFFAAGETTGGAVFLLEQTHPARRSLIGSLYDASTVAGILLASSMVGLLSTFHAVESGWRYLYWLGSATAIIGGVLRLYATESVEFLERKKSKQSLLEVLKKHKSALFSIMIAAGFSQTTYGLTFILMNSFVPLISEVTKEEVLHLNTMLLVFDMLLLPILGYLAQKFGKDKMMLLGAILSTISCVPLFAYLEGASLFTVVVVRFLLVTFGVMFASSYHAWAVERVPADVRCTVLSVGSAMGSQLLGAPTTVICLWLYKTTHWAGSAGGYLLFIGTMASAVVFAHRKKEKALVEN